MEEGEMGTVDNNHLCKEGTGILRVGSAFSESLAAWEIAGGNWMSLCLEKP